MSVTLPITPPVSDETIQKVNAGDVLLISGKVFTARDAAHKKLVSLLKANEPLPVDLEGAIIYYVGPTPAPPGRPIGSAGPTTSSRMDPYTEEILKAGVKILIGKGGRSADVRESLCRYRALYCAAVGGAAALISQRIVDSRVVAFEELGPEAIRELTVKDFPCIVINDIYGADLYEQGVRKYKVL